MGNKAHAPQLLKPGSGACEPQLLSQCTETPAARAPRACGQARETTAGAPTCCSQAYPRPAHLGKASTVPTVPTVHGVLKASMLKRFAIPFSSGPHSVDLSTMTCPSWLALHGMAHHFIELCKAVVQVIGLVSLL